MQRPARTAVRRAGCTGARAAAATRTMDNEALSLQQEGEEGPREGNRTEGEPQVVVGGTLREADAASGFTTWVAPGASGQGKQGRRALMEALSALGQPGLQAPVRNQWPWRSTQRGRETAAQQRRNRAGRGSTHKGVGRVRGACVGSLWRMSEEAGEELKAAAQQWLRRNRFGHVT